MKLLDLGYLSCLAALFLLALPAGECSAQSARRRTDDRPANLYRADLASYHPVKGGRDSVRFDDGATMTKAAAIKDLADFTEWMRKYYPGGIGSDARLEAAEAAIPDTMGIYDFFNACRQYVNGFHDSHLTMKTVVDLNGVRQYAPHLDYGFFDGRLIVSRTAKGFENYLGLQVDSIDGVSAEDVRRKVESEIGNYDGRSESMKQFADAMFVCQLFYGSNAYVPRTTNLVLSGKGGGEGNVQDVWTECRNFGLRPLYPSFAGYVKVNGDCGDARHIFNYLNDSTAYLGISSFEFGDKEIAEIRTQLKIAARLKIPNLIVDLRNNKGGYIPSMLGVLSPLFTVKPVDTHSYAFINDPDIDMPDYSMHIKEYHKSAADGRDPAKYYLEGQYDFPEDPIDPSGYSGRVYVLVNPQTFSAAAVMAGIIKRNHRGVVVGTETPAAYASSTGMYIFTYTMGNSGLRINVPIARTVYDDNSGSVGGFLSEEFPEGRGVMPDYPVELTQDVVFETQAAFPWEGKRDVVLDYTLNLIRQGRYREIAPGLSNTAFSAILRRYAAVSGSSSPLKGVLPNRLPAITR